MCWRKLFQGRSLLPVEGKSLLPIFHDRERKGHASLSWELFGNRAVRQGNWKLRWQWKPFGTGDWELFNLAEDPGERHDLAPAQPDKVKALLALWDEYVAANNVIVPDRSPFETLEDQLPQRVTDDPGYPPLIYKRQFVPPPDMLADPKP